MEEALYKSIINYFKVLEKTGYKSYDVVFKLLILDFIDELLHTDIVYHMKKKDFELIRNVLYQIIGPTCEISLPNNEICKPCIPTLPPSITISAETNYNDSKLNIGGVEITGSGDIQLTIS